MTTLVIAGVFYQPFGSFPTITSSTDGTTWEPLRAPIDINNIAPSCLATDGTITVVGFCNGRISVTSDLTNFSYSEIPGGFYPASMVSADTWFVTCGTILYNTEYGPYPSMSEVAQIYRSDSPESSWAMVWSHPSINSRFYQIKKITVDSTMIMVACGSVDGNGDAWYSIDEGFSWARVTVPTGVGPILSFDSIELNDTRYYYWGGNGFLYRSTSFDDTPWTGISVDDDDNVVDMINDGVTLVILGQRNVYHTNDGVYLKQWNWPGYTFSRASYIGDSLVVFGTSTLTQYTQWTTTDFSEWLPSNNGVHVASATLMIS